ncbi:hypothetical protein PRIPAC_72657 [Pristionchus pacificus]|uniref:Uncharacterized protein n=1 Tax=Pristionchus pacificus TaxID=54126 RepID=A0A454Y620_PRIPA|nr:hypothetical protein PRIPAC_72657 [Pristionchus pacificus]|eukprot:PDM64951.1 hypothetical protein PRIPAC_53207 [Pristionchus pacificus]
MEDDGGEGGGGGGTEVRVTPGASARPPWTRRLVAACGARVRRPGRTIVAVLGAQATLCAVGLGTLLLTSSDMPDDASVAIVPRPVILPVVLFLLLLLSLCLLSLVGVFLSSPLLCLPFLIGAVIGTVIVGVTTANAVRLVFVVHRVGVHVGIAVALILVLIFMIASLAVQSSYIRREVKNKKAVTGCPDPTEPKQAETSSSVSNSMTKFESFSRRSTLIISDDFFVPPVMK